MSNEIKHVNKQIAKGSAWMMLFKVLEKSISIISTIILARLLAPEDFGLVAMAMIVVTLLEILREFGFESAVIQNQQATREHYDTAWTFNILATILITLLLLALTPSAASFYNDDRLLNIIPALAIGVFLSGFENIGIVAFRKELTFHKDFFYMLSKKVISFISAMTLAFYFRNYWALIGAFIVTKFSVVILSYYVHPYRPKPCLKQSKELSAFSGWLFINNILRFLNQKMPELIVGKIAGVQSLGMYSISKDITYSTSNAIILPINRAAFPGFSKLNSNIPELKKSFLNTLGMTAILIPPVSVGIGSITPVMVPTLLGNQWLETIPVMQIFAFAALFFSASSISVIYLALGIPKISTKIMALRSIITIPILFYATNVYGIVGCAWGLLISNAIMLPIAYRPATKLLGIREIEILARFIRPLIAAGIMFSLVSFISTEFINNEQNTYKITDLIMLIMAGGAGYILSLLLMWLAIGKPRGSEKQLIDTAKKLLQKNRQKKS